MKTFSSTYSLTPLQSGVQAFSEVRGISKIIERNPSVDPGLRRDEDSVIINIIMPELTEREELL